MSANRTAIICSGYFDPLHVGHLDYLQYAAKYGDVWVIVNNDNQAALKKGKPFMPESERYLIIMALACVKWATVSTSRNKTVNSDIRRLFSVLTELNYNKIYFAKGGDSTKDNVPEQVICNGLGIEILWGVGGKKIQSSSALTGLAKLNE